MAYAILVIYVIIVAVSNSSEKRPVRPFTRAVAQKIREIMKDHALTQAMVAKLVNRDQSYISERVSGKRPFTVDEIDAIAELIGIKGSSLLLEIGRRLTSDRNVYTSETHPLSEGSDIPMDAHTFAIAAKEHDDLDATRKLLAETD